MSRPIVDERTLAGYLISPTEQRYRLAVAADASPLIRFADIEEHATDPETGRTLRCDLTLRSGGRALISAEMKRPEVMSANSPALIADAYRKAVGRGHKYFLTCDFKDVLLWETAGGQWQKEPVDSYTLAPGLSESYYAPARRDDIAQNWATFLDRLEPRLKEEHGLGQKKRQPLPPQAVELRLAIVEAGKEAAVRIREAVSEEAFRETVLDEFRDQFGVELQLDPLGPPDLFLSETEQVAVIASFVVASRLLLYQALSNATRETGGYTLDELEVPRSATDPRRIARTLEDLLEHARERTGDFETVLVPNELDAIVFVASSRQSEVGMRWGDILDVIKQADWTGPANYVPGLYESLLDEEHRHTMGVHYTPDPVAEVVAAYAVTDAADVVMDPASGAGTFVTMCYERKRRLGSSHEESLAETYGIEIADFAASLSSLGLTLADSQARAAHPRVLKMDFFDAIPGEPSHLSLPDVGIVKVPSDVDAIVGNPPYIRFENRTPEERAEIYSRLAKRYSDGAVAYPNFTGKADLWAFFVAHAHSLLGEGGRLGFVLSWNMLATTYGDAVLAFLGRYFVIDAIIDSRVERWFAAKQNTLLLLARKAPELPPGTFLQNRPNPGIPSEHRVRFVRLKSPLHTLLDESQPRGKQAEDLLDSLFEVDQEVAEELDWDIRLVPQSLLVQRTDALSGDNDEDADDEL